MHYASASRPLLERQARVLRACARELHRAKDPAARTDDAASSRGGAHLRAHSWHRAA